ncbi:MAG TPA: ribonuclease III [Candidatus Limnocylindrales bacterium]|nr:ribonuclease III [Candidatus Limnocylindrales bacterium]
MKLLRKLFGLDKAPKEAPPRRSGSKEFDLRGFEAMLHYKFKDPELARQALTHRSYLHSQPDRDKGGGESNERMEFLGDSVVGLVVNEFLYRKFTSLREGELTKMKSLLVSRVILSRTAKDMGLGDHILLSEAETGSGGRDRASILADSLEGVIGAVYLDGGLEPARQITERLLLKQVHEILSDANLANYKSMLQEYVQGEFKTHPQYRISSELGPDHEKVFTVEVVVSQKVLGRGHGNNKKEAEQEAARDALLHFEKIVRGGGDDRQGDHRRRRRRGGRGRRTRGGGRGNGPPQAGGRGPHEESREPREAREPREQRERRGPEGDKSPWAASSLQSEP